MLNLTHIQNVYFIGIGGIGMSALARYFHSLGRRVGGYDRTATEITDTLQRQGIFVHFEDLVADIPDNFKEKENTLVVYTPAIKELEELNFFKQKGYSLYKRSQVLGMITENTKCLAVAGTHGKTTTSAILAHLLVECGASVSAFLGGICENFDSNFVSKGTEYSVVEADEFDRSFLYLSPDVACITSMDADHLDIYKDKKGLESAFIEFTGRIKPEGRLLIHEDLNIEGIYYGFSKKAYYSFDNVQVKDGIYHFNIRIGENMYPNYSFSKPGYHNLLNALAAFSMAVEAGFPVEKLAKALLSFKGVKRRFSYPLRSLKHILIDDYAHHPSELDALYQGVKQMHPSEKITIVFQPHLYSRTQDFMDEFAKSLSKFDSVILLDIYPAREKPIEGVSSKVLLEKITAREKQLLSKQELLVWIKKNTPSLLVMAGAGDIGVEVEKIKKVLEG